MCECYGLFDPFDEFCYYCPYSFSCEDDTFGYYYDDYDEYWF
jgi:hypothetical protein